MLGSVARAPKAAGTAPLETGVSFGSYRFEPGTGRLWGDGREIRLTPKASAVLHELVSHAGNPVAKEDLFASVWSGTAVSDDALTSCVQELRRAFEDDPRQPRFMARSTFSDLFGSTGWPGGRSRSSALPSFFSSPLRSRASEPVGHIVRDVVRRWRIRVPVLFANGFSMAMTKRSNRGPAT